MKKWVATITLVVVAEMTAFGQDVRIVRPGMEISSIDISAFRIEEGGQGALFLRTLESDLDRSGWFVLSKRGGAAITLDGSYSESAGRASVYGDLNNRAMGRNFFRKTFDDRKTAARKLAHQLADEIVRAVKNAPGIAATRIAMVGARSGKKSVYLCDADGSNLVQLTKDDGICLALGWAPDGRSLVYTSYTGGFPDVYRIDLDANRRVALSKFPGLNACADIAPNGSEMALTLSKDGNPDLYVMGLGRRGGLERLTRTPHAAEASPSWSPDGKRVVYVSDQAGTPQLYVTDRGGRAAKRVTFVGNENVAPDWGPNGAIAYSSRRAGRYVVYALDPDTQVERQVSGADADYEDPSWAPDGRHIVCARKVNYHSEIYILDSKGGNPIRLFRMEGEWTSPAWSPK
ncbi:MAG: hypothetical protein QME60_07320 [Verrucomicrobiota bacterium]|nr:hypothetical protein [Verrucomicrobiota bacterium]